MDERVYTLQASILEEAASEESAEASPPDVRTIEILGHQTLHELHGGILQAFDRREDWLASHLDEGPHNSSSIRFGHRSPFGVADPFDAGQPVGDSAKRSIDSLRLEVDQSFGYWFDLWDGWHHEVRVMEIGDAEPGVRYPRASARAGNSPPRYPLPEGWDEDRE